MKDAQYFDACSPYAIGHDIASFWHNQLARPGNAPRTPKSGLFDKPINSLEHTLDNEPSGDGILSCDIGGFVVEICQRLA